MAGGGMNTQPIAPIQIIIPTFSPVVTGLPDPVNGMLAMSGSRLYLASGATWHKVTVSDSTEGV